MSQRMSWREWWVNRQKLQAILRELEAHFGDSVSLAIKGSVLDDPDETGYFARLQVHGTCEGIDERLAKHGAKHKTIYNKVLDTTEDFLHVRRVRVRDYTRTARWIKAVSMAMAIVSLGQIAFQWIYLE